MRTCIAVMVIMAAVAATADKQPVVQDDAYVTIQAPSGQPVAKYHYNGVIFKPYIQELYSPSGFNVVRDNVPDHIHHHGLMYAVGVDGVDFWAETEGCGKEVNEKLSLVSAGNNGEIYGGFVEGLNWISPKDGVLLNEERAVKCCEFQQGRLVNWRSRFQLPPGKETATLTGSHYFGLGMRFPQSMDSIGEFLNGSGQPGELVRGEEHNVQADWCAYVAAPEGKPITVAMFASPTNVRPTTWFTMPRGFAYMSATLNLHKEPLKLEKGNALDLTYGVAIWDSKMNRADIEKAYRAWVKSEEPKQEGVKK